MEYGVLRVAVGGRGLWSVGDGWVDWVGVGERGVLAFWMDA